MLKANIRNFQSIPNVALDIDGFSVIVGKNNKGKSAIIRAIDAALKNKSGSDFIQWGKTQAEVDLVKDDLDIKWVKGDSASYTINKKSYTKLNKAVPQPILDAGFRQLEVADEKLNPLVAHQFEEIFLINKPGPFVTEAISTLYDFNVLNDADILCQKKLRATKSIQKTRESDLEKIRGNLDRFEGLDNLKKRWEIVKNDSNKVEKLKQEIIDLESYMSLIKGQTELVLSLKEIKKIKIPAIEKIRELITDYSQLLEFDKNYRTISGLIKTFKGITRVIIPDTEKLNQSIKDFAWLKGTIQNFKGLLQLVQTLKKTSLITIPETNTLENSIKELKVLSGLANDLKQAVVSCDNCKQTLVNLKNIDQINDKLVIVQKQIEITTYLKYNLHNLEELTECVKDLKEQYTGALADYKTAKADYDTFKMCPLCNKTL